MPTLTPSSLAASTLLRSLLAHHIPPGSEHFPTAFPLPILGSQVTVSLCHHSSMLTTVAVQEIPGIPFL